MRLILILFGLATVCWGPAWAAGMGVADAQHLLLRTGFAPTEAEVQAFARLSRAQAVDRLLAETQAEARTEAPDWVNLPLPRSVRTLSEEERRNLARQALRQGFELRVWWYREMLVTPSPLSERMTLFWHNHFVSSLEKVRAPQLMYRQNVLLRRHAVGSFREMLHAIARDPAMVIYLDSASNRKGRPNENFARELLELFTLGEGHYVEQDVKEAARAFTGWSLDRDTYAFRFYRFLHDGGEKTVLGHTGPFDGDEVLEILLAHPATAEHIVSKLWREFVSPHPDPAEIQRLADVFRANDYRIKPLLRALFTSDAFYAEQNRGVLIKSPVELLVGTVRQFQIANPDPLLLALAARQLGQDVFAPPNVKGWPGGEDWINSASLLTRKQILARLFRGEDMPEVMAMDEGRRVAAKKAGRLEKALAAMVFDVDRFFAGFPGSEPERRARVERLALAVPPTQPSADAGRADFIRRLVLDPAYQLK